MNHECWCKPPECVIRYHTGIGWAFHKHGVLIRYLSRCPYCLTYLTLTVTLTANEVTITEISEKKPVLSVDNAESSS